MDRAVAARGIAGAMAAAMMLWSTAQAGTVMIPGLGGTIEVGVTSYQAQKFSSVLRQQYDFSCGSAALASLLTYHYNDAVDEEAVFTEMLRLADLDKVRREGFSMLDMKRYLEHRGYQADGFRMALDGLRKQIRLPVIVLLDHAGYRHFVVVKGIGDTSVLIGDPARGLKVYARDAFERIWDGTAFVIRSHVGLGRNHFWQQEDWPGMAQAPVHAVRDGPGLGHTLPYWPSTGEW